MELFILQSGKTKDVGLLTKLLDSKSKALDPFLLITRKRYNALHQINQQDYRFDAIARISRLVTNWPCAPALC